MTMNKEALPSDQLLDLHCAHGRAVYERCTDCEADCKAGKSSGFTPPGERGCCICGKKECRAHKP